MHTQTPKSLIMFRIIFGYLLIGATGISLWLSWVASRTTSTAIGLGLLLMMVSVSALGIGAALLVLESSHLKNSHHHTPVQGISLTSAAFIAAVSVVASVAVTYLHFITDSSQGFATTAVSYPPATALWCVTLLSLTIWVSLMAVIAQGSAAPSDDRRPEHTRT
ncbi:hypothetical protein ACJ65_02945 [Kocuria rhizophila]|nr:hypothetical protein ACJ65_02945 [Kocuria rhizophila]